jgi:CheY-like chemotaxis protein
MKLNGVFLATRERSALGQKSAGGLDTAKRPMTSGRPFGDHRTMGLWPFQRKSEAGRHRDRDPSRRPRGQLVLVVEDHEDTQTCIVEQLLDYGFDVVTASDGETAMRLIRERRPALVYLDMNLPNVSGYDVCEQIRADPSLRCIPVVMTSAQTSVAVHAACIEAGADAFVPKPFQLDAFAEMIGRIVCRTENDVL